MARRPVENENDAPAPGAVPTTTARRPRDRNPDAQPPTVSVAGATSSNGRAGASRLVINADVIEAREILEDVQSELEEKSQSMSPGEYGDYLSRLVTQRVQETIAETLLYQQGSLRLGEQENRHIDGLVDDEIDRIVAVRFDGSMRRFEKHLETQGTTLEAERRRLRRRFVVMRHVELNIRPKVLEPTRTELLEMFEASKVEFARPERRHLRLIELRVEAPPANAVAAAAEGAVADGAAADGSAAPQRPAARERAAAALAELRSGKPFAEVARSHCDGTHAADGGDWGWITRDALRERLQPAVDALFRLPEGGTSGIIESSETLFIVHCEAVEPALVPDFVSLQPELKRRYTNTMFNRLVDAEVEELRNKAHIEPENLTEFAAAVFDTAPVPPGIVRP